jgi:teichoic acid transport system ATP-binding protein
MDVADLMQSETDAPGRAGVDAEPKERVRLDRPLGAPTVVVDNVHITYRIVGAGGRGATKIANPSAAAVVRRVLARKTKAEKAREIKAVKGVSFVARQGEAIGLVGSNGSGKSTLLRAIAGLMPVNEGGVYTMGQPSLLGANAALLAELSGNENVIIGLLAMGMSRQEAEEKRPAIIDFSGIDEHGEKFSELPMSTYSSGMSARLRFAIAAAKMHEVLLVDEALATGDAKFRRRSEERVRELLGGAGTVFLVSHASSTIQEVCERSIWLERGVIRMDGPTDEVIPAYEEFMSR